MNSILGKISDTIQDVSKNITTTTIKETAGLMLQSNEELSRQAKEVLKKKITASNFITREDVQKLINSSKFGIGKNPDYLAETNKLLKSAETKDMDQFREIATGLSNNASFKDDSYLNLLLQADNNVKDIRNAYDAMSPDMTQTIAWRNSTQVPLPKFAENFIGPEGQNRIKDAAYHLNGKRAYFKSGDIKTNQVRLAGTTAGYMGTMTLARLAHGGSFTRNEYGERDIAGIPFV